MKTLEKIYLLSEEERKAYKPVVRLAVDITHKYSAAEVDEALNAQLNKEFEDACRKKRIRIQAILDIAKSALEKQWFTVFVSGAQYTDNEGVVDFVPRVVYSMITSDNPGESVYIDRKEYPDFYTVEDTHSKAEDPDGHVQLQRDALNLDGYLYVDVDTMRTLLSVVEVFDTGVQRVSYRPLQKALYPLDKVNLSVWGNRELVNGQMRINMKDKKLPALYTIDFSGLKDLTITKKLDSFDKAVYVAVGSLYYAGYTHMTASMIYNAMGHDSRPGQNVVERINKSLAKMDGARIKLDNSEEEKAFKGKYPTTVKHRAPLLAFEQTTIEVNGKTTDCAVQVLSEPFLMKFARGRGQITTIPTSLLAAVDHTDSNLRILHYLIWRIARANNSTKILFTTLQKEAEATTPMQKHRLPLTVERILKHFKEVGWIANYAMQKTSVSVFITENLKPHK